MPSPGPAGLACWCCTHLYGALRSAQDLELRGLPQSTHARLPATTSSLLAGAWVAWPALLSQPSLFAAAVLSVPSLDPLSAMVREGYGWSELGCPLDPGVYGGARAWNPTDSFDDSHGQSSAQGSGQSGGESNGQRSDQGGGRSESGTDVGPRVPWPSQRGPLGSAELSGWPGASQSPGLQGFSGFTGFPNLMLRAGLFDARVGYWEAAQALAGLRHALGEGQGVQTQGGTAAGPMQGGTATEPMQGGMTARPMQGGTTAGQMQGGTTAWEVQGGATTVRASVDQGAPQPQQQRLEHSGGQSRRAQQGEQGAQQRPQGCRGTALLLRVKSGGHDCFDTAEDDAELCAFLHASSM